jgi:hypothetical protein
MGTMVKKTPLGTLGSLGALENMGAMGNVDEMSRMRGMRDEDTMGKLRYDMMSDDKARENNFGILALALLHCSDTYAYNPEVRETITRDN